MTKRKPKLYKEVLWAVVDDNKFALSQFFLTKEYAKDQCHERSLRLGIEFRVCKVEVREIKGGSR